MEYFEQIAAERRGLADLAERLTPEQLATPSLCGNWTVQQVLGHLSVPLTATLPQFALAMLRARGDFDTANDRIARTVAERGPDELARILRTKADHRFTPPGHNSLAPLTDVLVHGLDLRRPLGIARELPAAAVRPVLDFLVTPRALRGFSRRRWQEFGYAATDLEWTGGAGPAVRGPAESLLLVLTGRPDGLADLDGDGVAELARALQPS